MIYNLKPFDKAHSLELLASASLSDNSILLQFKLENLNSNTSLPTRVSSNREIGLWERTCFEFFLRDSAGHYYEFNFSPCGHWNCFYFDQYRSPLKESECEILNISEKRENTTYLLEVEINKLSLIENFDFSKDLRMNLTAVIKENDLSYWAIEHSQNGPNFHDQNLFVAL